MSGPRTTQAPGKAKSVGTALVIGAVLAVILAAASARPRYPASRTRQGLFTALETTKNGTRNWFKFDKETATTISIQEYVRRGTPGAQKGYPGSPVEHIHPNQIETFEVISGVMGYSLNGVHGTVKAGEQVTVPAGAAHFFYNAADGTSDLFMKFTLDPKLNARSFFENLGGLAHDYDGVENIPILQLLLCLTEVGDTLPAAPEPAQLLITRVAAPLAKLIGYNATYPEYTSKGRKT